jgi:hypothetical protein
LNFPSLPPPRKPNVHTIFILRNTGWIGNTIFNERNTNFRTGPGGGFVPRRWNNP